MKRVIGNLILVCFVYTGCDKPLTDKQAKYIIKSWWKAQGHGSACGYQLAETLDATLTKREVSQEKWDRWLVKNLHLFSSYNARFYTKFCNKNAEDGLTGEKSLLRALITAQSCSSILLKSNAKAMECITAFEKEADDNELLRRLLSKLDCTKKDSAPPLSPNPIASACTLVLEEKYKAAIETFETDDE